MFALFILLMYMYLLFYIGLGIYQPIEAFITWIQHYQNKSTVMKNIGRYLICVSVYLIILCIAWSQIKGGVALIYLFLLPIPMAIWHYNNKANWKQEYKKRAELDRY